MHISPERFITTLQYPLAPPLPLLTEGYYPGDWDAAACATFLGRTFDQSVTAVSRCVATPLLATTGAARFGWDGVQLSSLRAVPLAVAGALVGTALGLLGASVSAADVLISSIGAALVLVWLVLNLGSNGITQVLAGARRGDM